MNSTELLMRVSGPDGRPATINQLNHARRLGAVSPPVGGFTEEHVTEFQEYVNTAKRGPRPASGEK